MVGWCVVCLIGVLTALGHRNELVQSSSILLDRDNWLRLAAVWLVLKILHEAAHGLTCLHFGGNVPSAGVLLILFAPLPFIDVTASWRFPSKWHRIATAAAGVYFELFVAAVAIILWNWCDDSVVRHGALNVAATAGVASLLINGNPLMRFDGYYILSDWLELPNLSGSGQKYIANVFQRIVGIDVPPDNRSAHPSHRCRLRRCVVSMEEHGLRGPAAGLVRDGLQARPVCGRRRARSGRRRRSLESRADLLTISAKTTDALHEKTVDRGGGHAWASLRS